METKRLRLSKWTSDQVFTTVGIEHGHVHSASNAFLFDQNYAKHFPLVKFQ